MRIYWFDSLPSTQTHAKALIESGSLNEEAVIAAKTQTGGIGSRNNAWQSTPGNLFCSFVITKSNLPADLRLQSASLYFGYLFKQVASTYASGVWLKWPNDLYLGSDKIGGVICWEKKEFVIAGLGLNLKSQNGYKGLDAGVDAEIFLQLAVQAVQKKPLWKEIFSKYRLEFDNSKQFFMHHGNKEVSLGQTCLQQDGSLIYQGKRIYSLR